MHEEQNNAPVKTVQSNRQEANFPNLEEKENLKQFYLAQSRRLCPTVSVDRSESQLWGIERSGFFNGREKWAKDFENQRV